MPAVQKGQQVALHIERIAHGGEGIALDDGKVVFVRGGLPGDDLVAEITESKKSFARGRALRIDTPSPMRVAERCPAAAAGGGCCDFGIVDPAHELELKRSILEDQLRRLGRLEAFPEIEAIDLEPSSGWRTRVRLGVDKQGHAGTRKSESNEIVTDRACTQAVDGLLDGIVGEGAREFTPGSEVVVVRDDDGARHVVEVRRAPRGRRNEKVTKVVEGSGLAAQTVGGVRFVLPAASFWQAHAKAPEAYSRLIAEWISQAEISPRRGDHAVGWDLYGGVGAFAPAILLGLGAGSLVHSVETSPQAAKAGWKAFFAAADGGLADRVVFHSSTVEGALDQLPEADVVVLDPPRVGAGAAVIEAVAASGPQAVIHIGCDPATFARDARTWTERGYGLEKLALFNAFPGTHHMEAVGLFRPAQP